MYDNHKKNTTTVDVDVTPISFQCYDAEKCPAIQVLQEQLPSAKVETLVDGTVLAKCPLVNFAQAQEIVRTVCFGCRARG